VLRAGTIVVFARAAAHQQLYPRCFCCGIVESSKGGTLYGGIEATTYISRSATRLAADEISSKYLSIFAAFLNLGSPLERM